MDTSLVQKQGTEVEELLKKEKRRFLPLQFPGDTWEDTERILRRDLW
jgi:hypothetical protein